VGSEKTLNIDGKLVRARANKWGIINIENENHCEFVHLRNFLTRTHLQDLIETTAQIHYESFRAKQLLALKESSAAQSVVGTTSNRPASPTTGKASNRPITPNGQEYPRPNSRTMMNGSY
jgi:septin 3/9/12